MENSMAWETDGRDKKLPAEVGRLPKRSAQSECMSLEEIVSLYRGRVARLAYRLLGWDTEAEDVVQDVFVSVLRNLKKFRGRSSLWTWLARITVNRCHNLRRRRLVRGGFVGGGLRRGRWGPRDRAARVAPGAPAEQIRRAVRSLPPRLRDVTVLRYLEEMSIDDIAEAVGASPNTVRVRLHRARRLLRRKLAGLIKEK